MSTSGMHYGAELKKPRPPMPHVPVSNGHDPQRRMEEFVRVPTEPYGRGNFRNLDPDATQPQANGDFANTQSAASRWAFVRGLLMPTAEDPSDPLPPRDNMHRDEPLVVETGTRGLPVNMLSDLQQNGGPEVSEPGTNSLTRDAADTVSGVVNKMVNGTEVGIDPPTESPAEPGVWIEGVWGQRQEVEELDMAVKHALEIEEIDSSKYFNRDFTEFASVAHYYVHIHDLLDEEEVDLLASFSGRLGEEHPLVKAMKEIMLVKGGYEELGASFTMEPTPRGLVPGESAGSKNSLTESDKIEDSKPPRTASQVNKVLKPEKVPSGRSDADTAVTAEMDSDVTHDGGNSRKQIVAVMDDNDDEEDDYFYRRMKQKGYLRPLAPEGEDLAKEMSAQSWLFRRNFSKMTPVDDGEESEEEQQTIMEVEEEQRTVGREWSPGKAHDRQAYERQGYERQGYERQGYERQAYERQTYERQTYERQAYAYQADERQSHERQPHERQPYARQSHERQAHERQVHERQALEKQAVERQAHERQTQRYRTAARNGSSEINGGVEVRPQARQSAESPYRKTAPPIATYAARPAHVRPEVEVASSTSSERTGCFARLFFCFRG